MVEPFHLSLVGSAECVPSNLSALIRASGTRVTAFRDPASFLARLKTRIPDCVMLDFELSGMSGPELHDRLLRRGLLMPVIFLVGYEDFPASLHEMKTRDADFLAKPLQPEALLQSLRTARSHVDAKRAGDEQQRTVLSHWLRLTPREREVLEHVLGGYLNKQTASRLGIAEKTVKVHRQHVMEKMDARSVAQLVRQCEMAGIRPRQTR